MICRRCLRYWLEYLPDNAILIVWFPNKNWCVSLQLMRIGCLLDALELKRGKLDDLLSLIGFGKYLFILDFLDLSFFFDVGVVELEQHFLVIHGLHPDLSAVALVVQLVLVR